MIILSDFSDVIAQGFTGYTERVCKHFGMKPEVFGSCFKKHLPTLWDLCRGKMCEMAFWHELAHDGREVGVPMTAGELRQLFYENMQVPMPGTVELYKRIQQYPVKAVRCSEIAVGRPEIVVVSDHIKEMVPLLHQWYPEFFQMVKKEFWSCEIGAIKADPLFFKTVLTELGVEPDDCLTVDDAPQNIAATTAAGIPAIHYENSEQLEGAMASIGFGFAPKADN